MLGFMGLAMFFLAVTMPLVLSREWITVSWAIQAFVMLWLADKLEERVPPPAGVSALRGSCCSGSASSICPTSTSACKPGRDDSAGALPGAVARAGWSMFGVPVASVAGAYFLLNRRCRPRRLAVDRRNDVPHGSGTRWAVQLPSSWRWAWRSCSCTWS